MRHLIVTLTAAFMLIIPTLCLAELPDNTEVEVIVEVNLDDNNLQAGDYNMTIPDTISSCSTLENDTDQTTTPSSQLSTGKVVQFEKESQDDNGMWTVNNLTILTGECLAKVLSELDEDDRVPIDNTLAAFNGKSSSVDTASSGKEDSEATATKTTTTTRTSSQGNTSTLHYENGVWKN